MYSIVLFIVDTRFSGVGGSGQIPTLAVDRIVAR